MNNQLYTNELAFIGLVNEYCYAIESIEGNCFDFVQGMLKLLPRIYIAATDLTVSEFLDEVQTTPYLDENTYDMIRQNLATLMEDNDVFLETFVEDMRYSDSPISISVSECLADLYQEFCDLIHSLKDMETDVQRGLLASCWANFRDY